MDPKSLGRSAGRRRNGPRADLRVGCGVSSRSVRGLIFFIHRQPVGSLSKCRREIYTRTARLFSFGTTAWSLEAAETPMAPKFPKILLSNNFPSQLGELAFTSWPPQTDFTSVGFVGHLAGKHTVSALGVMMTWADNNKRASTRFLLRMTRFLAHGRDHKGPLI